MRHLEHCLTTFRSLTEQAQATDHPSHRLFGALLAKAMHMPDPNHVYLVDDRPVLTFWGFIKPAGAEPGRSVGLPAPDRSRGESRSGKTGADRRRSA